MTRKELKKAIQEEKTADLKRRTEARQAESAKRCQSLALSS